MIEGAAAILAIDCHETLFEVIVRNRVGRALRAFETKRINILPVIPSIVAIASAQTPWCDWGCLARRRALQLVVAGVAVGIGVTTVYASAFAAGG
jgi:hypothetical protein